MFLPSLANEVRLVLASSSPRRRDILGATMPGLKFDIRPSDVEENLDKEAYAADPSLFAVDTARLKADDIFHKVCAESGESAGKIVVVGADTVVAHKGVIFGKPPTPADAESYLRGFSGATHQVHTGVVILNNFVEPRETTFSEATDVTFDVLEDDVIRGYVETGDSLDKAGGYGIQSQGGSFIKKINGCYYNVAGFPAHKFAKTLGEILKRSK